MSFWFWIVSKEILRTRAKFRWDPTKHCRVICKKYLIMIECTPPPNKQTNFQLLTAFSSRSIYTYKNINNIHKIVISYRTVLVVIWPIFSEFFIICRNNSKVWWETKNIFLIARGKHATNSFSLTYKISTICEFIIYE